MHALESLLDGLSDLLQKLYGLPAAGLVVLSCIVVGYALKLWKPFPNGAIPMVIILWGAIFMPVIADASSDLPLRVWIVRNVLQGIVLGFVAWVVHNKVLKKLELRWGLFSEEKAGRT